MKNRSEQQHWLTKIRSTELASTDVPSFDAVLNISDPATYLVRLSGDSMQGDGDLMIVSKGLDPVRGHIMIAVVNGDVMVKRLDRKGYRTHDNEVSLSE